MGQHSLHSGVDRCINLHVIQNELICHIICDICTELNIIHSHYSRRGGGGVLKSAFQIKVLKAEVCCEVP